MCTGIRNFRAIHIPENFPDILVKEEIGDELRSIKVMMDNVNLEVNPEGILPTPLTDDRLMELSYFKSFVVDEHQDYIASNY